MTVICRCSTLLANDIRMAADFDLPVLISAPPDRALMIATEIAAADRRPRPARVVVCASPADLFRPERAGTRDLMLIREVHEWTRVDQTVVKRLLGVTPGMGKNLGLDEQFAFRAIKQVGNYGEIFEKNLGKGSALKLDRGLNQLWTKGGLMYAMPFR